jgi:GTP-binding protein
MTHRQKPVIALVGRPNVGKSTLFNRLVGRQTAIVEDIPGVTRDRNYGDGSISGEPYIVIDTGGFEPVTTDDMLKAMRLQAEIAIDEADVVVCVFDGREGCLPSDEEIVRLLQQSNKPIHHAVNKIDGARHDPLVAEFWSLGVPMIWPISAQHGGGVYELMEAVLEDFPTFDEIDEETAKTSTSIAVIGKPNVGKSTLVNRLLGEERLVASPVPGTTRDSIDTWLELPSNDTAITMLEQAYAEESARVEAARLAREMPEEESAADRGIILPDGPEVSDEEDEEDDLVVLETLEQQIARARLPRRYLLIDTAGVRRRKWVKTRLEKYSIVKSFKSIDRADVCLLLIDATAGVTEQDAKLAGLIQTKGRACIILVNKWDLVPNKTDKTAGEFVRQLRDDLQFISYAPVIFISALSGQRVHRIMSEVDRVSRNFNRRVSTSEVNKRLRQALDGHQPPTYRGKRLQIYYGSQISSAPPLFILSVNYRDALHFSYERYLHNQIRQNWDFEGTPIKIIYRDRKRRNNR